VKVRVGDLVRPRNGRRKSWVGLVIEQREQSEIDEDREANDCLIQWVQYPHGPAWWVDWSLEVINESR
jgi:hypothetical protein